MKNSFLTVVLFLLIFLACEPAHARGGHGVGGLFGEVESIQSLVDIGLKGQNDEPLFLGYKTKAFFLIAGVYLSDGGYVLGIKGRGDSFYEMPTGEKLQLAQDAGLIPKPLPSYSIPLTDYLVGYSLWILIALYLAYLGIKEALFGKAQT